jgi:hypothetical protein
MAVNYYIFMNYAMLTLEREAEGCIVEKSRLHEYLSFWHNIIDVNKVGLHPASSHSTSSTVYTWCN